MNSKTATHTQRLTSDRFDVAIIGSGVAGSTLGAILARQGLKVILFEAGSHPKFAIGESMILETSEIMRSLAELYDIPELAFFSSENYFEHIGSSHGVKRHFSFAYHTERQTFEISSYAKLITYSFPKPTSTFSTYLTKFIQLS